MERLDNKLEEDLLLTKAMGDSVGKMERWNSLDDILDEVFMDGALDRERYLHSVMELTRLGLVYSDVIEFEDDEDDELEIESAPLDLEYHIEGLTDKGVEYINALLHEPTRVEKVKGFFKKFDEVCGKIADSGVGKLAGTIVLPVLALLI